MDNPIGIYEKALPKDFNWAQRLDAAKRAGFAFVEMSVDETDERLARLDMPRDERLDLVRTIMDSGLRIPSMCLSGHRRFPFGSRDAGIREKARELMKKGIDLALDLGIRNIQLAGYDVYYEEHDAGTEQRFLEGMDWAATLAAGNQVMLSMEIMDTEFMNSISKWKWWEAQIRSPWFTVYPDIGNLTAWNNDVPKELEIGLDRIAAIHVKETRKVTRDFPGLFRDMTFGEGDVEFVLAFRALSKLGYRGAFVIEMWTEKSDNPIEEVTRALGWIRGRMAEAERG
jgi:hexulose-6-phosphate isomerase, putative